MKHKKSLASLLDDCFATIQQNVNQKELNNIVTSLNDLFMFHNEINRDSSIIEERRVCSYTEPVYSDQVAFWELDVAKLIQDGLIKMLQKISPSNCSNKKPMYTKAGPLDCCLIVAKLIGCEGKRAMSEEKYEQINKEEEKYKQINKEEEKRNQIEKLIKAFNELRASDSPISVTQPLNF